ncbi:MAG TPA: GntR family transcriptional regulator [Tepidisphaeraceae bacterium]|jgi:DNA-binding GntR family transcriptional regulator|nr:GntR family transcriptional regulator [Tepidisphaeraceae bacterium]
MSQESVEQLPKSTRRIWVAKKILQLIFTGEFKGGDRLIEEEVAQKIGVSRTPVREALGELAGIGVISLKPNHGAIVRDFGPKQIHDIYHIRKLLESEATRLSEPKVDRDKLQAIRDRTQQFLNAATRGPDWSGEAMTLDQEFHELLAVSSGNERLSEEIGRYRTLIQSIREAVGNTSNAQDFALIEHTLIIDLLLDHQGQRAAEVMAQHIDRGAEVAAAALSKPILPA